MALDHEIDFQKNFGNWESLDLFEFFLDIFFGQIFFNEFFERIFGALFLG